jgi:AcrR family transcriptional regulator
MLKDIRSSIVNDTLLGEGRERIARDAIKAFVKTGYASTTTRQIAEACGMSEGSLYRYVGSKSDILHLIGRTLITKIDQPLEEYAKELGDISRTEALRKCWQYYISRVNLDQDLVIVLNREIVSFGQEDRDELIGVDPLAMRVFERFLHEGIQSGEFVCNNQRLFAYDMWILAQEWALKRWLLRRQFTLEQYTELHLENFLRSLGVVTY